MHSIKCRMEKIIIIKNLSDLLQLSNPRLMSIKLHSGLKYILLSPWSSQQATAPCVCFKPCQLRKENLRQQDGSMQSTVQWRTSTRVYLQEFCKCNKCPASTAQRVMPARAYLAIATRLARPTRRRAAAPTTTSTYNQGKQRLLYSHRFADPKPAMQ